jgi:hypothetical protein
MRAATSTTLRRTKRQAATTITSKRDTARWLAVFDDPLLGQGAVDRFKNNAYDPRRRRRVVTDHVSSPVSTKTRLRLRLRLRLR